MTLRSRNDKSFRYNVTGTMDKRRFGRVEPLEGLDDDGTGGMRPRTQRILNWLVPVYTTPGGDDSGYLEDPRATGETCPRWPREKPPPPRNKRERRSRMATWNSWQLFSPKGERSAP